MNNKHVKKSARSNTRHDRDIKEDFEKIIEDCICVECKKKLVKNKETILMKVVKCLFVSKCFNCFKNSE